MSDIGHDCLIFDCPINTKAVIMKYKGNTISKPVVGQEAKKLLKTINAGGHVANAQGIATARRIAERILKQEK